MQFITKHPQDPTSVPATATIFSCPETQVDPKAIVAPIATSVTPHQTILASAFALAPTANAASIT